MTMRWGYDPGEVEYLEQQEMKQRVEPGYWIREGREPGSPADNQEMAAGLVAGARAKRGDAFPSGIRGEREIKQPLASPTPTLPTGVYRGPGAEPGFFPGEPVDQPYQQPMFNRSQMWNAQPGYSINPYNPAWSPSALHANVNVPYNPMNYYAGTQMLADDPGLQGAERVFPQQEMTPGVLAGLLGQYGNPFWQQVGATPYGYNPMGMQPQPGVSNPMMSGIQRLLNRSVPARYGSRGR